MNGQFYECAYINTGNNFLIWAEFNNGNIHIFKKQLLIINVQQISTFFVQTHSEKS